MLNRKQRERYHGAVSDQASKLRTLLFHAKAQRFLRAQHLPQPNIRIGVGDNEYIGYRLDNLCAFA